MNTAFPFRLRRRQGFSLIETLMVVAILGVMCGILISYMTTEDRYAIARDKRNAQELASLCSSASAAGLDFVVADDLDKTLENLLKGGSPDAGIFKGRVFSLRSMDAASARSASKYLRLNGKILEYQTQPMTPSGSAEAVVREQTTARLC
jgi:prepilin-type N-terminal cleavage/methylation domain-containing protein